MTTNIYLQTLTNIINSKVHVTLETFIELFVYQYLEESTDITINFVCSKHDTTAKEGIYINLSNIEYKCVTMDQYEQTIAALCNFPVLVTDENIVIAGVCGVSRGLIKHVNNPKLLDLLGFKGACLMAPSEVSIWTKFCEVDLLKCTKDILRIYNYGHEETFHLSSEIGKFECHMTQPIRIHNVYKLARNIANNSFKKEKIIDTNLDLTHSAMETLKLQENEVQLAHDKVPRTNKSRKSKVKRNPVQITSNVPITDLKLDHTYVEGPDITLADIILYSCFFIIFETLPSSFESLAKSIPLTIKWMNSMKELNRCKLENCVKLFVKNKIKSAKTVNISYTVDLLTDYSLYKSDPKRYKPRNRIFTKQIDIDESLLKIKNLPLTVSSETDHVETSFDWNSMPYEAVPEGGELPLKRLERKKNQLQSLAIEILAVAKPGDRIVDFCSGAGHLGIILAYKLPKCIIILLENKEESLRRAKQRVDILKLTNILFFQSNLDYFKGSFNIGTSLHACGVATDIVLSHCLKKNAHFVCCPCCYGGIHEMHHISYPRSQLFKISGITLQNYMHIAHCADQAHDISKGNCNAEKSIQGQYCMDIVDTDRKLNAEESGYMVTLSRLTPENCSPKNRLLVGLASVAK